MTMPTAVLNGRAHDVGVADDPGARPRRRVFTAEYKLAILAGDDAAEAGGSKGSILRREGVHSSHIVAVTPRRSSATGASETPGEALLGMSLACRAVHPIVGGGAGNRYQSGGDVAGEPPSARRSRGPARRPPADHRSSLFHARSTGFGGRSNGGA